MGYQKEIYERIRNEYEQKATAARAEAEEKRLMLQNKIPGLRELDQKLSGFGIRILETAMAGVDVEKKMAELRAENQALQKDRQALLESFGYPQNFSDVHYACEKCSDTGYMGVVMCDCMKKRLAEASAENSGMGALLKKQTFDNFSLSYYLQDENEQALMKNNLQKAKQYAEEFGTEAWENRPMKNLLLIGGTGLGKTHLSSAIANAVMQKGEDVFYSTASGMFSAFEAQRFGNSPAGASVTAARFKECDLLILDDLGTELVNQFTESCLYDVLNDRINREKATVISTNLSSTDLRNTYGDRITSRLFGEFDLLPFKGEDIRKQKINVNCNSKLQ